MKISLISLACEGKGVFVQPYIGCENVAIHTLAALARNADHEVDIVDALALNLSLEQVKLRLRQFQPSLVGISPTLLVMNETIALTKWIKTLPEKPLVVLGGHHATLTARAILESESSIDVIVKGEADSSFPEILDTVERNGSLESISSILFRKEKEIFETGQPKIQINLNEIPLTARDTLEELMRRESIVSANIQTSRGCPYHCSFCTTPIFFGNTPFGRRRSGGSVVGEMEFLQGKYGVRLFFLTDDIFLTPNQKSFEWAREFSQEILARKLDIGFSIMVRAEMFRERSEETMEFLVRAGLHNCLVGVENVAEETLIFFSKGTKPSDYTRAIHFLRDRGVFLTCAFIMFEPHTSVEDIRRNLVFLRDIAHDPILYHFVSRLSIFPGTPIEVNLRNEGLLEENQQAYRKGFDYRFVHQEVGTLAKVLQPLSIQSLRIDTLVDRARYALAYGRVTGRMNRKEYHRYFLELETLSESIARDHASFVEKCLNLVLSGEIGPPLSRKVATYPVLCEKKYASKLSLLVNGA